VHLSGKAEFDISMRKAFLAGGAIFFSDEFSFAGSLTVGALRETKFKIMK